MPPATSSRETLLLAPDRRNVHALYPKVLRRLRPDVLSTAAQSWKLTDISNAAVGAALLGGGAGNRAFATQLLNSMSSALSYPLALPTEISPNSNACVFGRVGAAATGTSWSYTSLLPLFNQYVNFVGKQGMKWCAVPMDLTPENVVIPFALYQAANGQISSIVDVDGFGQGTVGLEVLKFQDYMPIAPACLNGGNTSVQTTAINFKNGQAGAIDSLSRSIIGQTPEGFQPQVGALAAWGGTVGQLVGLDTQSNVSLCANIGAYITSGTRSGADVNNYLRQLGVFNTNFYGPGTLEKVLMTSQPGRYHGRAKVRIGDGGVVMTAYFDNATLTLYNSHTYYPYATPFSICWFSEDTHRPLTNAELPQMVGGRVSIIVIGLDSSRNKSLSRAVMIAVAKSLKLVGYGGTIVNLA